MVEPITSANVGQDIFATTKDVDPGILMMAVSIMHIDAAHETARAKMGKLDDTLATLGKVAQLAGKVTQARNDVIQSELQATDEQLSVTNEFQARYRDNATISETDNQRFQEQKAWAAERGIELENSTKIIEEQIEVEVQKEVKVTDPDTGEVTTQTVTETETRTITREVADLDAIARNEAKIEAYKSEVAAGTADNAVLRQLIADHPEIQAVEATLDELGHATDLSTLSSLGSAANEFSGWSNQLVAQVQDHLAAAKVVHDQLTKLGDNWDEHLKDAADLHAQATEQEHAHSVMEQAALKLYSTKAEQMPEFLGALGDAIHETEQLLADIQHTHFASS